MNSQIIRVKYLQCQKGNYHQGQQLNTVCLNSDCKSNALCCCACVDEFHKGHKTTTLKKLLLDSSKTALQSQKNQKQPVKPTESFNTDIILNLIDSTKKDTFQQFSSLKSQIYQTLTRMQNDLETYFSTIEKKILNPHSHSSTHPSTQLLQSIETIQGSSTFSTTSIALQKLLSSIESINQDSDINNYKQQLSQDSMLNIIDHSNKKIVDASVAVLRQVKENLIKGSSQISSSVSGINTLFNHNVFYFSSELKSPQIWLNSSNQIVSKQDKLYQIALMQPSINSPVTAFKYKIKPNSSNWIAFGMCHKNIIKNKQFTFDYKSCGHGCYLISSNGGVWSNTTEELNNKIKAFTFKQGDTITCIVNRNSKQIFFIKDNNSNNKGRQLYEIPFIQISQDQLHPCVVFYFQKDKVEYIPAINLNQVPKYEYLFAQNTSHPKLKLIENRLVRSLQGSSQYRAAICTKSVQQGVGKSRKFTFKITKSTNNWVGVGMCHIKTSTQSQYAFNYQSATHGYYMISANGGSWSCLDPKKNNVVKTFKFVTGDVIECQVFIGNNSQDEENKIVFTKGSQIYDLNFKKIQGNKLHPCVMMYYGSDQVQILPVF